MDARTADTLRVVVFKDGDMYVAQCLEYDICAQGQDLDTVEQRFLDTLDAERFVAKQNGRSLQDIGQAPKQFFTMWEERSKFCSPVKLGGDDDGRV